VAQDERGHSRARISKLGLTGGVLNLVLHPQKGEKERKEERERERGGQDGGTRAIKYLRLESPDVAWQTE